MNNNPLTVFILWIGEVATATVVSIHLDFNMNDFRVWSLWVLSIVLGMVQLIGKETVKSKINYTWSKVKKYFR